MSKEDTDDNQPVSIEDEVASIIDLAETEEVIDDELEAEDTEESEEDTEESENQETEQDDTDGSGEAESGDDEGIRGDDSEEEDDLSDSIAEDHNEGSDESKLEAPEHWAATDRETFNEQTPKAQEWLLKRHKEMEGSLTRKSQEFASDKRQFDAIQDALKPFEGEFSQSGLDHAGAVRQLASWHNSLKTGGKPAILQLAQMYNIDLSEEDDQYIDPALDGIKKELSDLKALTSQQTQKAQQDKQAHFNEVITSFQSETDGTGKLKHPHFEALQNDITRLFNAGIATDLADGYNKALSFHPDLAPTRAKITDKKPDQAEKVKKAKKAATGIKSSGATKMKRADLSLEEEIASHIN